MQPFGFLYVANGNTGVYGPHECKILLGSAIFGVVFLGEAEVKDTVDSPKIETMSIDEATIIFLGVDGPWNKTSTCQF